MNPPRTQFIQSNSIRCKASSPAAQLDVFSQHHSASSVRRRKRRTAGFTLIELMVALTVGSLAVATFYTVARHTTRFFQEQGRVSNLQDHMRFAMAQIKRDLKRAGYLTPANDRRDLPKRCRAPNTQLLPAGANPGAIVRYNRRFPDNDASGIDPGGLYGGAPNVRVDRMVLLGNFETGATYNSGYDPSIATTVTLNSSANANYPALRDFGDWAGGDPTALDKTSFEAAFKEDRPIVLQGGDGTRHLAIAMPGINTTNFATGGGVTIPFLPQAIDQAGTRCALGNGWVAPLQAIEYTVISAKTAAANGSAAATANLNLLLDPDETLPQLHRREWDLRLDEAMADAEDRVILDYVVAFHLDFIVDAGPILPGGVDSTSNVDIIDWVAEQTDAQNVAAANPEAVRGARVVLAARASGHDRNLAALGIGPLQVFRVADDRRGGARVRTLRADIFIPNLALLP